MRFLHRLRAWLALRWAMHKLCPTERCDPSYGPKP
jgi:hypothetical protein